MNYLIRKDNINVISIAINAIENGKFDPSIRLAYSLSKIFSKAIEEVFDFEDN